MNSEVASNARELPLHKLHVSAQAEFHTFGEWLVPAHYQHEDVEYRDMKECVGVVDFSYLALIRVTGADRADYLNRRLSQKIDDLKPGMGRRATLLDGAGKMLGDMDVYCDEDSIFIISPPAAHGVLSKELEKYIFSEDCQIEDVTDDHVFVGLVGPRLEELLELEHVPTMPEGHQLAIVEVNGIKDVRMMTSSFVPNGVMFLSEPKFSHGVMSWQVLQVEDFSGHLAGFDAFNDYRIEQGCVWWGEDLDETTIPLEANLGSAIHEDKGCYPGQETIAKMINLGHPSRKYVRMKIDTTEPIEKGAALTKDGKTVGAITSSTVLPGSAQTHAIGWVKWPHRETNSTAELAIGDQTVAIRVVGPAGPASE